MKLSIISLVLFFAMALIYKGLGDYYSVYWDSVFWIGMYFMITALVWEKYTRAVGRMQGYLLLFSSIYFAFMTLQSALCLCGKDLYDKLIINTGAYSFGLILINVFIVILAIEFMRIKKNILKLHRYLSLKIKSWLNRF